MKKKRWLLDKRGESVDGEGLLTGNVMFIILNVTFFILLFIFVSRAGSGASIIEQSYAKQIALMIDSAKPGTEIFIDVHELYELSKEKGFTEKVVEIKPSTKEIIVRVVNGGGYSFKHFNNAGIEWGLLDAEIDEKYKGAEKLKIGVKNE